MRFTDLIMAIRAHADISESDAQAIAKGLIERGLITGDVRAEPKACECCGTLFYPDRRTERYCSDKCVSVFEHV